jgi:hypothetical protein
MSLVVSPVSIPGVAFSATLYDASQVRFVEPNSGIIHFTNGSSTLFSSNGGGQYPATFVPTANAGNVVPNPGDWLLTARPVADPIPAVPLPAGNNQGQQTLAQQFNNPGVPAAVFGAYYYYTNAQFAANFLPDYTNGLNVNQIVQ